MKYLLTILLLACAPAWAYVATPAEIQAECVRQMLAGTCTTRPAGKPSPDERIFIAGASPIAASARYDYAVLFNEQNPRDTAMCDLALTKTATAPGSDHDVYARAVWTPIKPIEQPAPTVLALPLAAGAALTTLAFVALTIRRRIAASPRAL